jgi:hypothetical protein
MPEPLKAPPSCPHCLDETDCSNVAVCRAVCAAYGQPVDEPRPIVAPYGMIGDRPRELHECD